MLRKEIKICLYLHAPGKSALHWAAAVNNVDAAVVLLKNGANKDMQNNKVQQILDKCTTMYRVNSNPCLFKLY